MIFVLRQYILPVFLLSRAAIEHTCIFALVAVLLDDAEDFTEDEAADSPTLFTLYPKDAGSISLHILAYVATLQDDFRLIDGMLSAKSFMLLAIYQVRVYMGLEPLSKSVDTRAFLKMLAKPELEAKRNWRNHKSQDSL
jgi:Flp pilus assembly pilin Flp